MDCFSSLAMTSKHTFTPPRRHAPEPLKNLPPKEGVGNAGCPLHPQPRVHLVVVERTRVTTSTPERPAFPHAMVLTVSFVLSPVTGLFCHRRLRIKVLSAPGRADLPSANLTPASGRQDHTTSPYAATSLVRSLGDRSQASSTCPAIPSRAKRCRVHRIPPRVRDDGQRPSCGVGWREFVEMICPTGEAKYFCKQGWTALSKNRPTGKSPRGSERMLCSCLGRAISSRKSFWTKRLNDFVEED